MAYHKSAKKRIRQTIKRTAYFTVISVGLELVLGIAVALLGTALVTKLLPLRSKRSG